MTIKDPWAPDNEVALDHAEAMNVPQTRIDGGTGKLGTAPASEGKIVLTFKEGTGFDSSWIVVHAGTVAEADALLDQSFADLMAKTKKVAAHFRGGSAPATAQRGAAPQGATEPPSWFPAPPAPDWVYKTGVSKGKVWHAWAPAEKGGGDWQFHRQP